MGRHFTGRQTSPTHGSALPFSPGAFSCLCYAGASLQTPSCVISNATWLFCQHARMHASTHTHAHTHTHTHMRARTHTHQKQIKRQGNKKALITLATHKVIHGKKAITVQYSAVQCIPVQCSAVQCSAVQYITVQYSTVQYSSVQYSTVQYISREHTCRGSLNTKNATSKLWAVPRVPSHPG